MTFGDRVKLVRESLNMTQEEFASLGGVQVRSQSDYERSIRLPSVDYLIKLSDAGIDTNFLLTGQSQKVQQNKKKMKSL